MKRILINGIITGLSSFAFLLFGIIINAFFDNMITDTIDALRILSAVMFLGMWIILNQMDNQR